jgi:hypothetical protein
MNNNGQNIIEYILLAVAALLVYLVLLNPHSGPIKNSVEATLNRSVEQIDNITSEIKLP